MARLCPHWLNYHGRQISDIALWGAPWVKVVDPDPEQCARLKAELGVKLLGRLSDLSPIRYNEYPRVVAVEHMSRIVASRGHGLVDVWETANEPGDLLKPENQRWLSNYWTIMFDLASRRGDTIAWGVFSDGTPPGAHNVGQPDWSPYQDVAVRASSLHPLALHEYWQPGGLPGSIPWHAGRLRWAPAGVRILITECGANRSVLDPQQPDAGWRGVLNEEQYLAELSQYRDLISSDPRVQAAFVYTYDYGSSKWETFDASSLSARIGAINAHDVASSPTPTPAPLPPAPNPSDWGVILNDLENVSVDVRELTRDFDLLRSSVRRLAGKG